MISKEFPPVSEVLLRELKKAFPDSTRGLTTAEHLHNVQGAQRVIDFLQAQFNKQNLSLKE